MLCVITTKRLLLSVEGPNDEGQKFKQVHKVDGPHKGSRPQSTTWTDPTRVKNLTTWTDPTRVKKKNLNKSTKWTDPMKGQDSSPHCGWTQWQGPLNKSTKRMDPTKGQYSSPQSGRTQQRVNTQVHNVDESNKGSILKSTMWTDPTKGPYSSPQRGRTPQRVKI